MRGTGLAIVRAIGAFALTLALLVGIPYLLIATVGNPFPDSVPSIEEVRVLLTQNGEGFTNFLLGTLAVLIWFLWLQLVAALVAEIVATVRQSETRRIPVLPGMQGLAAKLIATITLATTLAMGPLLAPAVGALQLGDFTPSETASIVIENAPPAPNPRTAPIERLSASAKSSPEQEATTRLLVHEPVELWDLADAAYGDGVSWKLIAQANAGHHDGGGELMHVETEAVASGTSLMLPGAVDHSALASFGTVDVLEQADHVANSTMASGAGMNLRAGKAGSHMVKPGESMWTIAEDHVEDRLARDATETEIAEYWVDVVDANPDPASGDVDLIYPGESIALPGSGDRGPAQPAIEPQVGENAARPVEPNHDSAAATPDVDQMPLEALDSPMQALDPLATVELPDRASAGHPTAPVAPPVSGPSPSPIVEPTLDVDDPADGDPLGPPLGLAALGASLLSAGLLSAVRRRRDLQRRTRVQGTIARPPSTEAAAFEAALAHSADQVIASMHGVGWSLLSAEAVGAMRENGPLHIHMDETGKLRAVALDRGSQTSAEASLDLEETIDLQSLAPVPPVLTQTRNEPPETPPSLVPSIAPTPLLIGTSTATGEAVLLDLASAVKVCLHGTDPEVRRFAQTAALDLAISPRVDDLVVMAIGVAHEIRGLERLQVAGSYAEAIDHLRACGHLGSGTSTQIVVLSLADPLAEPEAVDELHHAGAMIVAPGLRAEASIRIAGRYATLEPSGSTVELVALDDSSYQHAGELVEASGPLAMEPADDIEVDADLQIAVGESGPVEAGPIEVRVLGPVEIAGAGKFSSLKAVDVVTYLAFHRNGADADQIKTWVWPPFESPTDKAFANVLSRARTGLGSDSDGSPYLSRAGADKTYRLAASVTSDFERFRAIVELAETAPSESEALALFQQALELIRGVPFTGGAASSFAWADNHVRAQVEYTIDEVVHRSADAALELRDLETARWIVLKGLELVPGCEQCFRRRFLIAGAGRNRNELRRAMADLERSAAIDLGEPEIVDCISSDLLDLYHELDRELMAGAS